MNKLTAIRIKYDDGTYSDEIPVSTLAEYILWDDSHNLVDILGNIDMSKGTVQAQLNEKIDDNELDQYLSDEISTDVTNWLNTNVTPVGSAVIVDLGLTIEGAAADAKKTGDELTELNERLDVTKTVDTTLSSSDLENGALDANGMNAGSMNYRVRTSNYIELPENGDVYVNVVSDENVYFTAWYFTVNDFATSKIRMEDWRKSGKLNVPSNAKYVRFVFSINKSTNPISPSNIDSVIISHVESALDYVVKVTQQTLTNEQKAQARANIGAISDEEGLLANFTVNNGYICQVGGT